MACILADYGPLEDVTINIEHTLLEAFCMENYIKVIKVSNASCILLINLLFYLFIYKCQYNTVELIVHADFVNTAACGNA